MAASKRKRLPHRKVRNATSDAVSDLPRSCDFLVVGAGVVGLTIALALRRRHPGASIVVVEKERAVGEHASGRNSGVLHAGFYYSADSLKARLTRVGNERLTAWCGERGVEVRRCGKLVVARDERDLPGLDELARRGARNGVPLEGVTAAEALHLEPWAQTHERALFSPTTSVVDPAAVMAELARACGEAAIAIWLDTAWRGFAAPHTLTSRGRLEAGFVVNAAGLFADRVARAHGFAEYLVMLPFKGLYLYGNTTAPPLRRHVYPVPDLEMPFLGVHFTVTLDGRVKIGPTAMPAPWREGYDLGASSRARFAFDDLAESALATATMLARDSSFRRHAFREAPKMLAAMIVRDARRLVPAARASAFDRWGRPGIRAQLFDRARARLVMDFHHEGDARSLHVLNAVSPAFTCSFAFAELICDAIEASQ
jgi:(S)-2-hydroxyglutarate dehydrogenase